MARGAANSLRVGFAFWYEIAMAKALVTGGAGFIGSHLATALVEHGETVCVLDNMSSGKPGNLTHLFDTIEFVEGDILDSDQLDRVMRGVDVVFHHAALASVPRSVASPRGTHDHCTTGTFNVLEAARRAGVRRVVFASSSSAYGDRPTPIKRESDPPAPLSPYAASKLAGEMYCQSFAASFELETVALRYFNVFGPRQDPHGEYSAVIPKFVTRMIENRPPIIFGDGRQSRDFVYIDDVVQANLAAARVDGISGQCFNIACGKQINLLELVESLNNVLGTKIEPVFESPRPGDVRESLADISAAQEKLGYRPQIAFEEGLTRSIDYYRSIGTS